MWSTLSSLIPIAMFFVKLFISSKDRQNQIESNMQGWFKVGTSEGEKLSDQQSELKKQEAEVEALRKKE